MSRVDNLDEKLKKYRLNRHELGLITERLGREPEGVEWALFSALWSEHCSYKSSKVHLKKLFNKSKRVLESFGENAGVVDLGAGERIAFKIESHNHPSFIEPYQGAATGVGGILRDIFTMGARPIALADYLCFGEPAAPRMRALMDGVVRGIGGYGNCVGVPTVTGQTEFHESYNSNILVNAMAVGLFSPGDRIFLSKARGAGNWVVYAGAKTGRDGVHGASMASESFGADSAAKRPTVQIGDPFFEKLLIESCLEVMAQDLVVAIQDMGAAGLTSSSFEMASKGQVGLRLQLDDVPLRDPTMSPEEILLSESQERMLLICEPEKFSAIQAIFHRWGLDACKIGEVQDERVVELRWHGETISRIDPDILVEQAPQYMRAFKPWKALHRVAGEADVKTGVEDGARFLRSLLGHVHGTSRSWIYKQYDSRVGAKTVRDCAESVAIQRLPDSGRGLGIVLGCRPHMMRWDAREGGIDAVAYPALELAAKGFEPLAVTDCLNYGNPEKEHIMSEFVASVEAMSTMCEKLDTPIISGNVSFYNETMGRNITSTPATGLVGLRDHVDAIPHGVFTREGEAVYLLRLPMAAVGGAAQEITGQAPTGYGQLEPSLIAPFARLLRVLTGARNEGPLVSSSRVVGKFGLAYALARMCAGVVGCRIEEDALKTIRGDLTVDDLFREHLYEVILTALPGREAELEAAVRELRGALTMASFVRIGRTIGAQLEIGSLLKAPVASLAESYQTGVWAAMEKEVRA
ncbi:MAG: phosphoribosylformylglycinamidine synthase subunit PurL [Bdellovibrionaceae bacterium]|nr:phosphoribosylformylglycinamidine synthase subunit PurL [Pseudobdellovibrionaceae bacterium]